MTAPIAEYRAAGAGEPDERLPESAVDAYFRY